MLDYEWGNPSAMMLPGEEPELTHHHHHHHGQGPDPTRQSFHDHYGSASSQTASFNDSGHHHFVTNNNNPNHNENEHNHHHNHHHDLSNTINGNNISSAFSNHLFNPNPPPHHHPLFDTRGYPGASGFAPQSIISLDAPPYLLIPKAEDQSVAAAAGVCRPAAVDLIGSSRIGLNLGGRTYFSSSEDDFMNRLYRRPRAMEHGSSAAAANAPRCQAEGCNADLSHAKHYHRRHKVCEFHSKASTVIAAGLTQRFCQQCSRFHLLSEFDNGKRSCRKRLADHNRRRRKTQAQQPNQDNPKPCSSSHPDDSRTTNNQLSSDHCLARSPPDSGAQSSSSVTVAVSPPRMSLDCFRQRSIYQTTASSGSSNSLFFSSG